MPGSMYTYALVQISIPDPVSLVVITNKSLTRYVSVPGFYQACLANTDTCSYKHFYDCCRSVNALHHLQGDDARMLARLGGLRSAAAKSCIVTLTVCCKVLQQLSPSSALSEAMLSLKDSPASQTVLALPDHVMAACAQPSTNPPELQMTTPFPTTLPDFQLPANYRQRYGLQSDKRKRLCMRAPLSQHMHELKAWLMTPVMLSRKGLPHGTRTWENNSKQIHLFLGYCNKFHNISQPTLQHFLFPHLLAHFVSFHVKASSLC